MGARLALLTLLLGIIVTVQLRDPWRLTSFTVQVALATIGCAFALSAVYGVFLRQRRGLRALVTVQLVLDQVIWTVVVYLSGGISSGATSFYGLSCLFGAALGGFRGAAIAALSAAVSFLALVAALTQGWIQPPPDQPLAAYLSTREEVLYSVVVNGLVLVVVALLAGNLAERLRLAGGRLVHAELQLSQAQREAELGRLAAGLAHEIRNPLGSISGSIRLLRVAPELSEEDQQLCEIVDREAARLNDLVTDMLNLAKPKTPQVEVVNLTRICLDVVSLAGHSGRSAGDVVVRYVGPEALCVLADAGMLRQMLWNLVRNAVQATRSGGEVIVEAAIDRETVRVSVVDRGDGIGTEDKGQLFDAFFTTRSQGTGIGLAVVKRIVDDHGWSIAVTDTEGGGATFCVVLGPPQNTQEGSAPVTRPEVWTLFPKAR
jgi:signal transduction histidine kinase